MQEPIGRNGQFRSVPHIPATLTGTQPLMLIPDGFEDLIQVQLKQHEISITLLNDEYRDNEIIIPDTIYNPEKNRVSYPKFLIERGSFKKKIDYFTDHSDRYIFNQNEILYIALQHRLLTFVNRAVAYSRLLVNDISAVNSFANNTLCVAYNAKLKDEHSYIILSLFNDNNEFKKGTIGDLLNRKGYIPNSLVWARLKDQLPIQYSSESGCSKTGKLVLSPYANGPIYRSIGHSLYKDEKGKFFFKSLFKSAQNITARNKTHVTADAKEIYDFVPTSNFAQDYIYDAEKEIYVSKDQCYKAAIVVIRPINEETQQYLYGECEVTQDFYNTYVWKEHKILEAFDHLCIPEDGDIVHASSHTNEHGFTSYDEKILIGRVEEDGGFRDVYIEGVKAVQFVRRRMTTGPYGRETISLRVAVNAGNARIDSNTGLKAVTKGKPYLGKIVLEDGTILRPDMAFGMNSFKAKQNGIKLARAALAVDLKTYAPKHWSNLLNTLDEDEINNASKSLPSYSYYDEFGELQENVQIGIVYYRYTELTDVYASYGNQSMSHECGRNLYHNLDTDLFKHIWDRFVNPDMKEALIEFQKILLKSDVFQDEKDVPHYTIKDVKRLKLFNDNDILTSTIQLTQSSTVLLDEEFNSKGFFFDFRPQLGPLIRIPCAKTLKMFESELATGAWMYHAVFITIGKIIKALLTDRPFFIFNRKTVKEKRDTLSDRYLRDIYGIIFTSEKSAEMRVTTLSNPQMPGFAMKQSVDVLLPNNTLVITDDELYQRIERTCFGKEDGPVQSLQTGLYGLHVRNPALWRTQLCKVKIWTYDDYRIFLMSQYGISIEKYLLKEENKSILLFSKNILGFQHSDVDGDHSPIFTGNSPECQKLLQDFVLTDVCKEELEWTQNYIKGEFEANDGLIHPITKKLIDEPYKLYDIALEDSKKGREVVPSYSTYLFQAVDAKGAVGNNVDKLITV